MRRNLRGRRVLRKVPRLMATSSDTTLPLLQAAVGRLQPGTPAFGPPGRVTCPCFRGGAQTFLLQCCSVIHLISPSISTYVLRLHQNITLHSYSAAAAAANEEGLNCRPGRESPTWQGAIVWKLTEDRSSRDVHAKYQPKSRMSKSCPWSRQVQRTSVQSDQTPSAGGERTVKCDGI